MSLPACRLRRQGVRAARAGELTLQIDTRVCVWWVRWWRRSGDVDALVDGRRRAVSRYVYEMRERHFTLGL